MTSVISSNANAASSKSSSISSTAAWIYFAVTFAWTFVFWGAAALTGLPVDHLAVSILLFLGGTSPALAAILLTQMDRDSSRRRDFYKRITDVRRIRTAWFLVIFLTVPLISILSVGTHALLTGEAYLFDQARAIAANPAGLLPMALGLLVFGPVPEELGWRGCALERLQSRWNAVASSVILAFFWAAWHIPLFFIQGTYQQALGFGTAGFWLFMAGIFPETVLMTCIFNNTRRSILAAILYHFMINFTGQFIDPAQGLALYRLGWTAAAALLAILIFGRNLSGLNRKGAGVTGSLLSQT